MKILIILFCVYILNFLRMQQASSFPLSFFVRGSIVLLGLYIFFYILFLGKNILIPLLLAGILAAALGATKQFLEEKCKMPHL